MEIKRIKASTSHDAIKKAKDQLGPDAVILSTEKTADGVEIIAASMLDINLLEQKLSAEEQTAAITSSSMEEIKKYIEATSIKLMKMQLSNKEQISDIQNCMNQMAQNMTELRAASGQAQASLYETFDRRIEDLEQRFQSSYLEDSSTRIESYKVLQQQINELRSEVLARVSGIREFDGTYLESIYKDVAGLKDIMNYQSACLDWGSWSKQNPMVVSIVSQLASAGFGIDLSKKIVSGTELSESMDVTWNRTVNTLIHNLKKAEYDVFDQGGVFVLLGQAGVGKTTTLAKLAANYAMKHGTDSILFVNTDDYRIGAQDQLSTYANILNIHVESCGRNQDVRYLIQKMKEHRLVLIDTAGQNAPDPFLLRFLDTVQRNQLRARKLLLMSASTQLDCLRQIVDQYRQCDLDGYVITKTDETHQLGNVLTVAIEDSMPLWYETNGQRVPEDFCPIDTTGLIQRAFQHGKSANTEVMERELLLNYQ